MCLWPVAADVARLQDRGLYRSEESVMQFFACFRKVQVHVKIDGTYTRILFKYSQHLSLPDLEG